jgi:cytidine deaminase
MTDSPRWCDNHKEYGDHHTDRCPDKSSRELTFKDALRAAHRSQLKRHRTGAAVYDSKGELLSIGWSHPCMMYSTTTRSQHAEHHALGRLPYGAVPHTVVIVTLTKADKFAKSSHPCESCRSLLDKYDVQEIITSERKEA